ncbi:DUF4230 domain-containing protein [Prevotella sp. 885]|uniref:DUF4230 domain-containing protein n=1 Tax=Prevotella sp. 885 TaxID=2022527 RepID=UPI000B9FF5B1|nr:DUF4230 domain-containing protein [Prevotella sp. 885]OZT03797.1 hypothetical protein CHL74_08525 [Prevotella sp. 885]
MKTTLTILAAVMSLAFCSCGSKPEEKEKATKPAVDTMAVMVMQVQRCSKLYTTEYRVHKVLTHDDKLEMKGKLAGHDYNIPVPLGKRKVAIPIDATIKAYIDFATFSSDNVERDSTHIRITLPDPHIVLTSSRIDHNAIKQYVALTRRDFSDEELTSYERQGRDAIIREIATTDIMEQARVSAANTLVPMLQKLGYRPENITIAFSRNFSGKDIIHLIDKTTVENAKKR